jgi:hypothetical protein
MNLPTPGDSLIPLGIMLKLRGVWRGVRELKIKTSGY